MWFLCADNSRDDYTDAYTRFVGVVRRLMGHSKPVHSGQHAMLCEYMQRARTNQWKFAVLVAFCIVWLLWLRMMRWRRSHGTGCKMMRWRSRARRNMSVEARAISLAPWFEGKWDHGVIECDFLFDLSNGHAIKIEDDSETLRTVDKPELFGTMADGKIHWINGVVWTRRDDHFSEDCEDERWRLEITGVAEDGKQFDITRTDLRETRLEAAAARGAAVQIEQVRCGCLIWSGRVNVTQRLDDPMHIFGQRTKHPCAGQFLVGDALNVISDDGSCFTQ